MTKTFEVGADISISASDHEIRPSGRESRMPEISGLGDQRRMAGENHFIGVEGRYRIGRGDFIGEED